MRANKKSIGEPNHRPAGVRNNAGGLHHHRRGLRGQVMQMPGSNRTVLDLAAALAAGRTSIRELVEAALARVAAPDGEGARTFVAVYADSAMAAADAQDRLRKAGYVASPLAGLPVSVKDLFDVAGERTLAGSKALDDSPPAAHDAPTIARLRAAGRGADRPHQHDRVRLLRGRNQPPLRHTRQSV